MRETAGTPWEKVTLVSPKAKMLVCRPPCHTQRPKLLQQNGDMVTRRIPSLQWSPSEPLRVSLVYTITSSGTMLPLTRGTLIIVCVNSSCMKAEHASSQTSLTLNRIRRYNFQCLHLPNRKEISRPVLHALRHYPCTHGLHTTCTCSKKIHPTNNYTMCNNTVTT